MKFTMFYMLSFIQNPQVNVQDYREKGIGPHNKKTHTTLLICGQAPWDPVRYTPIVKVRGWKSPCNLTPLKFRIFKNIDINNNIIIIFKSNGE